MNATRYGFKIVNRERIWIVKTVIAHHIKWMGGIDHIDEIVLFFDLHQKISFFVVRLQGLWFSDVSLTIG